VKNTYELSDLFRELASKLNPNDYSSKLASEISDIETQCLQLSEYVTCGTMDVGIAEEILEEFWHRLLIISGEK
jgi:hypothetical protein